MTRKEVTKKYKVVGRKRVGDLTNEDKKVMALHSLYEAQDRFSAGLMWAGDCNDRDLLQEFMYASKSLCFDVEALGIDIGSMN